MTLLNESWVRNIITFVVEVMNQLLTDLPFRQRKHHLYGRFSPLHLHSRLEIQRCIELLVAIQSELSTDLNLYDGL